MGLETDQQSPGQIPPLEAEQNQKGFGRKHPNHNQKERESPADFGAGAPNRPLSEDDLTLDPKFFQQIGKDSN